MDDTTSQPTDPQDQCQARKILSGMSSYRIDPSRVKIPDGKPHAKGGQGTIVIGTVVPPAEFGTWLTEIKVAVKKFEWDQEDLEISTKFFKSFAHELSVMATLSHPNVVKLIGFVEDIEKGDAWIIVPLEVNGNVRQFLKSGHWDIPERISLVQDVIRGAEYLHSKEPPICHGDLKSLNILVNSSYRAVIIDFGSARIKRNANTANYTVPEPPGQIRNDNIAQASASPEIKFNPSTMELTLTDPEFSLNWIAPEVLRGQVQDLPSDMWAIGWVCWEIVTGKLPFEELDLPGLIISRVITAELPAIRENDQLSHVYQLCSLMSDCWRLNPEERINVSNFWRKIRLMPSAIPSRHTAGSSKIRSATLLDELGTMYLRQNHVREAQSYFQLAIDVANQTSDKQVKAKALTGLGHTYRALSNHGHAQKAFRESHEIHSLIGNDAGAANALEGLGESYRALSKYDEAEKALREAFTIHSRIGDDLGTANALDGLGYIYRIWSRLDDAEKAFTTAHEIHSRTGNDMGLGNTLNGLGEIYCALSKHGEAEKAFKDARKIHSLIGNDLGAANALYGLGQSYRALSMDGEAEKALLEAIRLHSAIGNDLGEANAWDGLGEIYRVQAKHSEAEKAFKSARRLYSRVGDTMGEANALCGLGQIYRAQSKYEEAEGALGDALDIHSQIRNDLGSANAWKGLGEVYSAQSKYGDAEKAFREAHEMYSRIGNAVGEGNALWGLGQIYSAQSRIGEAEKAFKDALKIHSSADHRLGTGNALRSLGMLYNGQRQYTKAKEAYHQAITAYDLAENRDSRARTLLALGETHYAQAEYNEARDSIEEALAIWISLSNNEAQAVALFFLSRIFGSQSKYDTQVAVLRQAEDAFARVGDHKLRDRMRDRRVIASRILSCLQAQLEFSLNNNARGEATQLCNLGGLFSLQGQHEKAEEHFVRASVTFASISDHGGEARALDGLMGLHVMRGKFAEAKAVCQNAREIYTRMGMPMSELCAMTWGLFQS
ncbi:hypothetical protein M407DRAFT_18158 [Tulasnella calospora MUT 4182]|uniref:Protein kinase domain-containing protein n=1 Tax=Tulasnella calospora MUT 4182 TaxID=1051891 RepID=A0A0C3QUE5_9AGAM|nr:hypothetical protein M407DRAFT_18158 [Tulasnella calospora MUT 4182]